MKLENVNSDLVLCAVELALADVNSVFDEIRENELGKHRFYSVLRFLGREPRIVERTDEEILNRYDMEFQMIEWNREQRRTLLCKLWIACDAARSLHCKMTLNEKEIIAIKNYLL